MKKLRIALSKKQKGEQLIARLKELKKDGELDDGQFEAKQAQYAQLVEEGTKELEGIRESLTLKKEALDRDLERYPADLKDLELKNKLGEIDANQFARQEQRLRSKIDRLEKDLDETQKLLAAKTAEEAGGFIDIQLEKRKLFRRPDWL